MMFFCYVGDEEIRKARGKMCFFVRINGGEWRRYENFAYICAKFVYGCTLLGQDILGT